MPWLGYTRVSRVGERGDRLISPELQARRITSYADAHHLAVELLDPELDVSGGKLSRPILDAAIGRIERGEAEGLIVAQLDRLSRAGIVDTHKLIERIEAAGGHVIAVAEDFDSSPEGGFGRNVFLAMGQMQRERIRIGFEQARRRAVERGIWAAKVPIGYVLEDRRLSPGPNAPVVLKAFEARAAGQSWVAVGNILGRGYSGAQWIIANRVYLGEQRMKIAGEVIVNRDSHPALVSRELFEAAQLQHPRYISKGGPALLAGIIRCAGCGGPLTPRARGYDCIVGKRAGCSAPASISRHVVEPYVEGILLSLLRGEALKGTPRTSELDDAAAALSGAEGELAAYQEAIEVSAVGAEHFARGMAERVRMVENARAALGAARSVSQIRNVEALAYWDELSVNGRRHVLRSALSAVMVSAVGQRTVPVSTRVLVLDRDGLPMPRRILGA